MRLEWARTLQGYGEALLGEHSKDDGSYRQGLKYLEEAREVFRECNAVLDLHRVEGVIDRYTAGAGMPVGKGSRGGGWGTKAAMLASPSAGLYDGGRCIICMYFLHVDAPL